MRIRHALIATATLAVVAVPRSAASAVPAHATSGSSTERPVRQLLVHAARTEAAASLQYAAYGVGAAASGQLALARVLQTIGESEYQDHWTREVTLAKLYSTSDNAANLRTSIALAKHAARAAKARAAKAPRGSAAAKALVAVAARESASARLLTRAALEGRGTVPAAPRVTAVPIRVSPRPRYAGAFYNDLTNDSTSALATAAWNWAAYQWFAHIAADTGQARLAALFSGLAEQERYQNWPSLSNAAGYVHGNATNLRTLIAAEQGATSMYSRYAARARQAGNTTVASAFRDIGGDELGHRQSFTTSLQQLRGGVARPAKQHISG